MSALHVLQILTSALHLAPFSFFFNDTATTEIYTLSLHDALPIFAAKERFTAELNQETTIFTEAREQTAEADIRMQIDRKSTRLNSSHDQISYAVFCLKKKKHQRDVVLH